MTRRSCGLGTGRELSKMALTSEKMTVPAPMPRASDSTATAVKPGFFSNWRKANFNSFMGLDWPPRHRDTEQKSFLCDSVFRRTSESRTRHSDQARSRAHASSLSDPYGQPQHGR